MSTTVVRDGTIWTGGANPRLVAADLVIVDGKVAEIAPDWRGPAGREIDAGGCLVLPGFINAHVHAGCTPHIRGVTEDDPIPPGGAYYHAVGALLTMGYSSLTRDELAALMEWDAVAMLVGGATTIVEENFGGHEAWVEIVGRLGFRSDLGLTYPNSVASIGYLKDGAIVMGEAGDVAAQFAAGLALLDSHASRFEDRLRAHLSPHGPDTVPEEILRETARVARERGVNANLHLAQHLSERRTVAAAHDGKSSIRYLHDIGFLGPHVMAMHVTFIDDGDIPLLAATGTTVVHGAYRKAKEALISPFLDYIEGGCNAAIATDSFSHDLIQDLRFATMLGKIRTGDSGRPVALTALRAATHGAAVGLRRPDLGHLEPGARGDVTVVDLAGPFNSPVFDPVRALVYYSSSRDIRCTLVDGMPVVQGGRVLGTDMEDLGRRARAAAEKLWRMADRAGLVAWRAGCGPGCTDPAHAH